MTWVFVGGEGCESKGGARGGRLVTFLDGGFRSGNSPPKDVQDIQVLEDDFSYNLPKIYDKKQSADCYPEVLLQSLFFLVFSGVSAVASR